MRAPGGHWLKWRVVLCASVAATGLSVSACKNSNAIKVQPGAPGQSGAALSAPASALHFVIDPQLSEVLVLVYRDGPMGHLGHNHVIAVRSLSGSVLVASDRGQSTFQLEFPVEALSVDEPQLRTALGADFQSPVDEAAIAGTRDHMLGASLLNAQQYPRIRLRSAQIFSVADGLHALTSIQVGATTTQADIPMMLTLHDDDLTVSGEFDLTHNQLGLTPYSVALGALRVAERMHVHYRLVARHQI